MGVIAELVRVASSTLKKWHAAPGTAIVVTGKGLGGAALETEVAHTPGVFGRPPKDFHGVFLPVGRGRRYGVMIAGLNYNLNINISAGETAIYSTDANGTLKARIDLDASGVIKLNGETKRLVTYGELNTALGLMVTAINAAFATKLNGAGAAGTVTLNISAAETTTVKTGG